MKAGLACAGMWLSAACNVSAQAVPPVREFTRIEAASREAFQSILDLQALANGRVLVNDGVARRVVVLDSTLTLQSVLLDSVAGSGTGYGPTASPLIRYRNDSVLFVDGASRTLLVIDPTGRISHTMSAPKAGDLSYIAAAASGTDARGNLVYRGIAFSNYVISHADTAAHVPPPDSAPLLRGDFETRTVDTIARIHDAATKQRYAAVSYAGRQLSWVINPVATPDEWAVLSDGSIAIVRGHDYHIDWVLPNGTRRSSSKLPFDWKKLTDEDKTALKDSAQRAEERLIAEGRPPVKPATAGAQDVLTKREPDPIIEFVPMNKMPDYYPAIRAGAVKADLDNRVWILPTTSAESRDGELVYDVVNNLGALATRVRVPKGRSIAGFGRDNVVYLKFRDFEGLWHVEKTRLQLNGAP